MLNRICQNPYRWPDPPKGNPAPVLPNCRDLVGAIICIGGLSW